MKEGTPTLCGKVYGNLLRYNSTTKTEEIVKENIKIRNLRKRGWFEYQVGQELYQNKDKLRHGKASNSGISTSEGGKSSSEIPSLKLEIPEELKI